MLKFTNKYDLPLPIAAWLAKSDYSKSEYQKCFSASELTKSVQKIILSRRAEANNLNIVDVMDLFNSRTGTAIHNEVERAMYNIKSLLPMLGIPELQAKRIVVNPTKKLEPYEIPVYTELRGDKEVEHIDGCVVTGQFDFTWDGQLHDIKKTNTFGYMSGSNTENYKMQGSIYRWIFPELITEDTIKIVFMLTDWIRSGVQRNSFYPKQPIIVKDIELYSVSEMNHILETKLQTILDNLNAPEEDLPECNISDLWQSDTVWKYYKNPKNQKRSTKNFTNLEEANLYMAKNGNQGVVIKHPGKVTACLYCSGFSLCKQKDKLISQGLLVV